MKRSSALLVATTMVLLSPISASADTWYPQKCDIFDYCAAIDSVVWAPAFNGASPRLMISSRYGQAAVHAQFPVHESNDGLTHVCMRYDPFGQMEVTCLMVPIRH